VNAEKRLMKGGPGDSEIEMISFVECANNLKLPEN
jgi:hypothetical protein